MPCELSVAISVFPKGGLAELQLIMKTGGHIGFRTCLLVWREEPAARKGDVVEECLVRGWHEWIFGKPCDSIILLDSDKHLCPEQEGSCPFQSVW
jgi:hypothetical protein